VKKPEFIQKIEGERKTFSSYVLKDMKITFPKNLQEKKYFPVYSERIHEQDGKTVLLRYILKSAQGFYLCFDKSVENNSYQITIYFEESQDTELQFFIKNFLKTFKNDTTDN
jgi:hypothetical protein